MTSRPAVDQLQRPRRWCARENPAGLEHSIQIYPSSGHLALNSLLETAVSSQWNFSCYLRTILYTGDSNPTWMGFTYLLVHRATRDRTPLVPLFQSHRLPPQQRTRKYMHSPVWLPNHEGSGDGYI
jgi:hypothetical protein